MMSRRLLPALAAVLLAPAVAVAAPAASAQGEAPAPLRDIRPVPQQVENRPSEGFPITPVVGLVRTEQSDPSAEMVVRRALQRAGVTRVVTSEDRDPGTPVTVWLGGGDEVLLGLGAQGADGLRAEGYVLAAGRDAADRGHVVLDGVDADGTFYAAQTFRQAIQARSGADWMPGVTVRDWPSMRYRGLIEGFYGTPWSHADRLRLIDHLGAHKMNTFEYAPKDDPYHRERWRDPYPADKLAQLGDLVDRASANHVDFTFALSPGLSICYSSQADFEALVAKFEALYDLGTRSFNIPLDDIDYNDWHCDEDIDRFGTGAGAAGHAQAYLLNRVQREWVEPKGDVEPLQMVPTEYYNVAETPYKRALREQMDRDIVVMWTGIGVVPEKISVEQARQAREVFGHEILVWDNYPVNDYIAGRVPLAPYSGRESGLSEPLTGIVSNPMNQAAMSELALSSFGDFGWNDAAYDADESWRAAIDEIAGGDGEVASALRTFADLTWYDGTLHRTQSPVLRGAVGDFWEAWHTGDRSHAVTALRRTVQQYAAAPAAIRAGVADARFIDEAEAWLSAAELWLRAMDEALTVMESQHAGDGDAAWAARQRLTSLVDRAVQIRDDKAPHSSTYPRVGDGVVDRFVDEVLAGHDRWVGVRPTGPQPTTTLGTYRDHTPELMVDGDAETFYWSNEAPGPGDAVGVDLGRERHIGEIEILMGKPSSPGDYMHDGVLEYSTDGRRWTTLSTGSTPEVRATAAEGTTARFVRYRSTGDNSGNWLVVREFAVDVLDETLTYQVSGTPPAASGSGLRAAADGRLDTSYVAARPTAADEALTVTASQARPVDRVLVLQSGDHPSAATLQLRGADGTWQDAGHISDAYAEIDVDGVTADGFRLLWRAGDTPQVAEVVPRYADVPVVALSVEPGSLEVERGGHATFDVLLESTRAEHLTGELTVDAPASWDVQPRQATAEVPRGGARTVQVSVGVPSGAALGEHPITVSFTAGGERAETVVDAVVHLPTTDENVALGSLVTASGTEPNTSFEPRNAVDGDLDTRWASGYDDASWLQVELSEPVRVGRAVLRWEAAFGESYDLQASDDGVTWRTVAEVRNGDGGVDTVRLDSTARFFRMQGVERATAWGYSLYELELYPVDASG